MHFRISVVCFKMFVLFFFFWQLINFHTRFLNMHTHTQLTGEEEEGQNRMLFLNCVCFSFCLYSSLNAYHRMKMLSLNCKDFFFHFISQFWICSLNFSVCMEKRTFFSFFSFNLYIIKERKMTTRKKKVVKGGECCVFL